MKSQTELKEGKLFVINKESCGLSHNTLIPSLTEAERFIKYLDKKFTLSLPADYIIVFNRESKNTYGSYTPLSHPNGWVNSTKNLHTITINTHHLKRKPYTTLAHELAHYLNAVKGIKDCSSNQYHNKHFKSMAESLLLTVEKQDRRGFALTTESDAFKKMILEFKPNNSVWNVEQSQGDKNPLRKSRNYLFECSCGYKIRCAKRDLKATCSKCNGEFENDE